MSSASLIPRRARGFDLSIFGITLLMVSFANLARSFLLSLAGDEVDEVDTIMPCLSDFTKLENILYISERQRPLKR